MTPERPMAATMPAIPAQRPPTDLPPVDDPQADPPSADDPLAGGGLLPVAVPAGRAVSGRRRKRVIVLAAVTATVVLLVGLVVARPVGRRGAVAAGVAPTASALATPYDQAVEALARQSAAVLAGDETAWLSAVGPSLRTRYRAVFRSLRALRVTRFEYQPDSGEQVPGDPTAVLIRVDAFYCFGPPTCPPSTDARVQQPPRIAERLTFRPLQGRYVIVARKASGTVSTFQPLPWENGKLAFARGRRVVVASPPSLAKRLPALLKTAERAAAVGDRYARLLGTTQREYRIYLAGERQWKAWYGGDGRAWVIGSAFSLSRFSIDVVIRDQEMTDSRLLRVTLQHELGHVVTLAGAYRNDTVEDDWLNEGVAEYIAWRPFPTATSWRRFAVRWALNRPGFRSIVQQAPGRDTPGRAVDAFYGLAHLAVECMATTFDERKMLRFVKLVITNGRDYDRASRDAFGRSFARVDKACTRWIRRTA